MRREVITISSDLSGEPNAITHTIGLDGLKRAVDLTDAEFAALNDLLEPYLRVSRTPGSKNAAISYMTTEKRDVIRVWANANGYKVAGKGRIAKHVLDAYRASHQKEAA